MDATEATAAAPPFEFAHYAHLLRSLMPRARVIALYGPAGELRWASEGLERPELRPYVESVLAGGEALRGLSPEGRVVLVEGEPAWLFRVLDDAGEVVGLVAVISRPASAGSEPPDFVRTRQHLAPLLELLRRDMISRMASAADSLDATVTRELEFLLSPARDKRMSDTDPLQYYVDGFRERTRCSTVLLIVPDWKIERWSGMSATTAEAAPLRRLATTSLWKLTQAAPQIRVLDSRPPDASGGTMLPHRYLSGPLHLGNQVIGLLLAVQDTAGKPFGRRDIERLSRFLPRIEETLEWRFDARTGLLQRATFELEVAAARQTVAPPATMVVANLDRMHVLNDTYGFAFGDRLIRSAGALWRAAAHEAGALATRLAGDRFAALLPTGDPLRARAWADVLRNAVGALRLVPAGSGDAGSEVSLSVGIARLEAGQPLEHALAAAEIACNTAKEQGRNRIEIYDAAGSLAKFQAGMKQFREMTAALEEGRFALFAQAIVPLWDRSRPFEFEILLRMRDSAGKWVDAADFLPTATRHQMMGQLDQWVVSETLARLQAFAEKFEAEGVRVTLNVSEISLADGTYAEILLTELAQRKLSGGWLSIDIGEGAASANREATRLFIEKVARAGVTIALDDFGSARSALADLRSLAVRRLKIDGSFVRDVATNPNSESLVRAVVQIARQLGLETSGEWVEDAATASQLAALGVDYGQGRHWGGPAPLLEFLQSALAQRGAPAPGATPPRAVTGH